MRVCVCVCVCARVYVCVFAYIFVRVSCEASWCLTSGYPVLILRLLCFIIHSQVLNKVNPVFDTL